MFEGENKFINAFSAALEDLFRMQAEKALPPPPLHKQEYKIQFPSLFIELGLKEKIH